MRIELQSFLKNKKDIKKFCETLNNHIPEYDSFAQHWELSDDMAKIFEMGRDNVSTKAAWSQRLIKYEDVLNTQLFTFVACAAYDILGISTAPGALRVRQTLTKKEKLRKFLLTQITV